MRSVFTDNEKEFLKIWDNSDEKGRVLMLDMFATAVAFGEEWFSEMDIHLKNRDAKGAKRSIEKFKARLEAKTDKSKV